LSYFNCPICRDGSKELDKSFAEQGMIVRKLVYDCGTVLKLISDGMRFREVLKPSEKCIEYTELNDLHNDNNKLSTMSG